MKIFRSIILAACACSALGASAADVGTVVATDAYSWRGDTIFQGPFKAWAVTPYEIKSTYRGRPGYFMTVEQSWSRKNDLSSYPRLSTPNKLHQAVYNLALDEMVNAVEPDTTLRTGKEWAGVWTRDVSYSIILAMASDFAHEEGQPLGADNPGHRLGRRVARQHRPHDMGAGSMGGL